MIPPVTESDIIVRCRLCGEKSLSPYLDLGFQPPSNSFIYSTQIPNEQRFPLIVCLCQNCGLSQLSYNVDHKSIFDEYAYRSSSSRALISSFRDTVHHVDELFSGVSGKIKLIDVGCNDGLLLEQCSMERYEVYGLEPSEAGEIASQKGFHVIRNFLTAESGQFAYESIGPLNVVVVTNVLAHVPNIENFVQGITNLLDQGGFWVVEFPYVLDMLQNLTFDTVYHEHFSYLSISPLLPLFNKLGLWVVGIKKCEVGGSGPYLRLTCIKGKREDFASRQDTVTRKYTLYEQIIGHSKLPLYLNFAESVKRYKDLLIKNIEILLESNEKLGGYGAPAKGNTLLNYLNLNSNHLVAIADNTIEKIGRITPGSHIPVVSDEEFSKLGISTALLLSWNYHEFFRENSNFYNAGGKFLVPFPYPRIDAKGLTFEN